MAHTNIHDPLHVYSIRELPLTQLPVDNTIDTLHPFLSLETNRLREKVNKALNCEKINLYENCSARIELSQ